MTTTSAVDCHVAIELSRRNWLVGALLPGTKKVITTSVPGGDADGLIAVLAQFPGVGEIGATVLVTEVFHRTFASRRHLASYLGLSPTPFASGGTARDQGISKAGNRPARVMLVELAWCWLRYQSQSRLARWYRERFSDRGARSGKVGIVALARKLAIALWHYVEDGIIPDGAKLKAM